MKGSGVLHTTFLKSTAPVQSGSTVVVGISINSPFFENGRFKSILLALVKDPAIQNIVLLNSDSLQRHTLKLFSGNAGDLTGIALRDGRAWQERAEENIEQLKAELGLGTKLDWLSFISWQSDVLDDQETFTKQLSAVQEEYSEGDTVAPNSFRAAVDKTVETVIQRFVRQEREHKAEDDEKRSARGSSLTVSSPYQSLFAVNVSEPKNIEVGSDFHTHVLQYILEEMAGLAVLGTKHPEFDYFAYPQRPGAVPAFIKMRERFLLPNSIDALRYLQLEIKSSTPAKAVAQKRVKTSIPPAPASASVPVPVPVIAVSPSPFAPFADGVVRSSSPPGPQPSFYTNGGAGRFTQFGAGHTEPDRTPGIPDVSSLAHGFGLAALAQEPERQQAAIQLFLDALVGFMRKPPETVTSLGSTPPSMNGR